MATALDVITRALKKLRVISSGETPTSDEADDCVDALNDMLSEWRIDGIDLAPTTLATTDTLDVPADHLNAVVLNLALRVGGMFGAELSQADSYHAENARRALVAYHFTIKTIGIDHPLTNPGTSD